MEKTTISLIKWHSGWLQYGHDLKMITKEAEKELIQLKLKYPDWDFNKLCQQVKNNTLKPK